MKESEERTQKDLFVWMKAVRAYVAKKKRFVSGKKTLKKLRGRKNIFTLEGEKNMEGESKLGKVMVKTGRTGEVVADKGKEGGVCL